MAVIKIQGYQCDRCNHKWSPKDIDSKELPNICPKCKNPNWNKGKK
jgi:DNA-directed RNA polymerase subunit RPC12/RpoP